MCLLTLALRVHIYIELKVYFNMRTVWWTAFRIANTLLGHKVSERTHFRNYRLWLWAADKRTTPFALHAFFDFLSCHTLPIVHERTSYTLVAHAIQSIVSSFGNKLCRVCVRLFRSLRSPTKTMQANPPCFTVIHTCCDLRQAKPIIRGLGYDIHVGYSRV